MLSGALVGIADDFDLPKKPKPWERVENGTPLKSVLQLKDRINLKDGGTAQEILAIHEHMSNKPQMVEKDGQYSIVYQDKKEVSYAKNYLCDGFLMTDTLMTRTYVRQLINRSVEPHRDIAWNISLDVRKARKDHPDNWMTGFRGRKGNVDHGIVYGKNVAKDMVFGKELERAQSPTVGWETDYFGAPMNVKVTDKGSVIIWAFPPIQIAIEFIQQEIMRYAINL
jgi:hypothetical protein